MFGRRNNRPDTAESQRSALLKTTTKALVGWIAIAIILSAKVATAGPSCYTSQVWLAATALGQAAPADTSADNKNQQTADLLRRARQAMAENDLGTADRLISQPRPWESSTVGCTRATRRRRPVRTCKRNARRPAPRETQPVLLAAGKQGQEGPRRRIPFAGRGRSLPCRRQFATGHAAAVSNARRRAGRDGRPGIERQPAACGSPRVGRGRYPPRHRSAPAGTARRLPAARRHPRQGRSRRSQVSRPRAAREEHRSLSPRLRPLPDGTGRRSAAMERSRRGRAACGPGGRFAVELWTVRAEAPRPVAANRGDASA